MKKALSSSTLRRIFVLTSKEWKGFFHTSFGMLVVPLYLLLGGSYFYAKLDMYLTLAHPTESLRKVAGLNVNTHLLIPFFKDLLNVFIFIVPLITMRSFAEEKKQGTYDLLISYPLKPWEILMGKYLGAAGLVLFLLALSLVFPALVIARGQPFLPQIASNYLGLVLFILFYVAVGIVGSLMTENQIVAAIIAYGAFLATFLIQWAAHVSVAPFDKFFANYLLVAHLESFRSGLIFVGDIAAYLSTTAILLLAGYWKLRRHYVR